MGTHAPAGGEDRPDRGRRADRGPGGRLHGDVRAGGQPHHGPQRHPGHGRGRQRSDPPAGGGDVGEGERPDLRRDEDPPDGRRKDAGRGLRVRSGSVHHGQGCGGLRHAGRADGQLPDRRLESDPQLFRLHGFHRPADGGRPEAGQRGGPPLRQAGRHRGGGRLSPGRGEVRGRVRHQAPGRRDRGPGRPVRGYPQGDLHRRAKQGELLGENRGCPALRSGSYL